MKKILGLDLGSASIGWAYILDNGSNHKEILKLGVRVIPLDSTTRDEFNKGNAVSINKERTLKRTARKTGHRYKLRRKNLSELLKSAEMLPSAQMLKNMPSLALFGIRARAAREQISLVELGRVLFHLNQKRGYRSSRKSNDEAESGKKLSDYLTALKDRKELIEAKGITIGEYFYEQLTKDAWYRIKENVFPRECYLQEFDQIWSEQQKYYPEILTEHLKKQIRDKTIFYQRPLKSAKWLVGECRFEKQHKATPVSSPLFQVEKIWESIHNIILTNKRKEQFQISDDQKFKIFEYLDNNDRLTKSTLTSILGLEKSGGWIFNEQISKTGIQGNTTKSRLLKIFKENKIDRHDLLKFDLHLEQMQTRQLVNKDTGELTTYKILDASFEKEPLYRFWHVLYATEDPAQTIAALEKQFGLSRSEAITVSRIDFTQSGFGNKSARAIRKLLPHLLTGFNYTQAAVNAGYRHSDSMTKTENEERQLSDTLTLYAKNSLRQPVVEKVLNQVINLVNAILLENGLGRPDEIRVELARDLKQSKDERTRTYDANNETDKRNKLIAEKLQKEFPGLAVTRKVLEKYKLHELQNGLCIYSGQNIPLSMALKGDSIDVDHIIPQTKLFDDSFQNKVLVYQSENRNKSNLTAFDYMKSKSEEAFLQYTDTVNKLFETGNITRAKRDRLLMTEKEIPEDFVSRQMNETRYISKEATKLLKSICRNVYSTTGSVTEFLRHQWGYNEVLKQLNWSKYEKAELIKDGKIENWSKRDDHRHHAIDALVVACTDQRMIQRLNTLNSSITRENMLALVKGEESGWQAKRSLLEQTVYTERPFTTQEVKEAVNKILISQKAGKKVATLGKNEVNGKVQKTLTPRGYLHKETVYGKIRRYSDKKIPLNSRFAQVDAIVNEQEKAIIKQRLAAHGNNPKTAFAKLDKNPIWMDESKTRSLSEVTVWEEFFVVKYELGPGFKEKDVSSIIDLKIRGILEQRFKEKGANALKNLENDPIWLNEEKRIPIKSVRCFTGLTDLVPLHNTADGDTFGKTHTKHGMKPVDYVSTRNNHHVAIYRMADGKLAEIVVSLWDAVNRKEKGLSVIIKEPKAAWDYIQEKGIEDQTLLSNLPLPDWTFVESMQQNEMFVFRMSLEELEDALRKNDIGVVSDNLYRVQNLASCYYVFRHHLETRLEKNASEDRKAIEIGKLIRTQSLESFLKMGAVKVRVSNVGNITPI